MTANTEDVRDELERSSHDESRKTERLWFELADAERRLLARRLHDDVGQRLTGVALLLRALIDRLESTAPSEAEGAASILGSLRETITGIRRISRGILLTPPSGMDLHQAMEDVVSSAAPALGLRCDLKAVDGDDVRDPQTISQLCHIAHGAMLDAAERGRATHVSLRLCLHDTFGALEIDDDGVAKGDAEGDTMAVLRHRAALVGGTLTIHPHAEGGRRLVCTFRLDP
jgi:signal transduction histidine kinase